MLERVFLAGWIAAALISTTITPALAQPDAADAGAACALVEDSLARLTCFDKAFPKAPAAEVSDAVQEPAEPSLWQLDVTKSAIDDSPAVYGFLPPVTTSGTGAGSKNVSIFLRCMEGNTSVVLSTEMFMVDETAAVTIRLDSAPATTTTWNRSTDYKALGLWGSDEAIPLIRDLAEAKRVVVRIVERDRIDAEFELTGVGEVAAQVAEACDWTL